MGTYQQYVVKSLMVLFSFIDEDTGTTDNRQQATTMSGVLSILSLGVE